MPIDYSKFDQIEISDSDVEEDETPPWMRVPANKDLDEGALRLVASGNLGAGMRQHLSEDEMKRWKHRRYVNDDDSAAAAFDAKYGVPNVEYVSSAREMHGNPCYVPEADEAISDEEISRALRDDDDGSHGSHGSHGRSHGSARTVDGIRRTLRAGAELCHAFKRDPTWNALGLCEDVRKRMLYVSAMFDDDVDGFRKWIRLAGGAGHPDDKDPVTGREVHLYDASAREMEWYVRVGTAREADLPNGADALD